MERLELIAPCHFGLEAVLKREILELGYEIIRVEDGRILFEGDAEAVCRANIYLRTAERILIKAGEFHAETFEELFQGTKAIPWEHYIPVNGKFYVTKAASVKRMAILFRYGHFCIRMRYWLGLIRLGNPYIKEDTVS